MIMQTLIKATILAIAALAANAPGKRADSPETFRLWANMTYPDLPPEFGPDVQGQELSYVSNDECAADVILVPAGQGSLFRTDGDITGVDHFGGDDSAPSAGMVARPGGTSTVPGGFPIELQCSNGTSGIFLNDKGLDYPEETRPNGGWMACRVLDRDHVFLSMFSWGQRPLSGCSVVQLLPIYWRTEVECFPDFQRH